MSARTRSDIGRSNARRGKDAERRVANYLREHGFPHAERAVRTGYATDERTVADPGDLTGTPGLVWQVKDAQREQIAQWWHETDQQGDPVGIDLALLVVRRRGHADEGRWWVWLPIVDFTWLATGSYEPRSLSRERLLRLELGDLVPLLHAAGYGEWA
ncbi:hypothetical protein [Actinopolyspora halophila]|uniref:hypothetical protein n=1 Tax=Actinopolyspora halophila TaxID=1850 RepID=UPI0003678873|nr:hypothetical protein [Actinopolyspora halophila]